MVNVVSNFCIAILQLNFAVFFVCSKYFSTFHVSVSFCSICLNVWLWELHSTTIWLDFAHCFVSRLRVIREHFWTKFTLSSMSMCPPFNYTIPLLSIQCLLIQRILASFFLTLWMQTCDIFKFARMNTSISSPALFR